jgi:hypothetical protein
MSFGPKLPKSVKRITFLQRPDSQSAGSQSAASTHTPAPLEVLDVLGVSRKKKKMSRGLRAFERWTRRFGRAVTAAGDHYVIRHDRSNRKKRDGWLRDYIFNMARANRQGLKRLHIPVFKL